MIVASLMEKQMANTNDSQIEPDVRAEIERRLAEIEASENVRVLLAVESGSRAWGFPSPDSDYDVRFVYARPVDWYLSIDRRRDVIERPIDGDLDINGWDLKKALQLLIKPNAVMHEWLESPIKYREEAAATARLRALADETLHRIPATYHYLHLGEGQWRRFIDGRDRVAVKKYFYVLRPALALCWLRQNDDDRVPMNIAELRAGCDLPADVDAFLDDLIERKRSTKELGQGPRIPALDRFVTAAFAAARERAYSPRRPVKGLFEQANQLFRDLVLDQR